jgi:MoaA/NifB/PqqE/SkfB family radical SAM enzyme
MRFPLSLTRSMTGYLLKQRWAGRKRFPLVLMLEPSHACNLHCAGCGRVREYADTVAQRMSVEECLAAVEECGVPVVSVCGGEPLVYPGIEELLEKLVARRKHVYLCTNGLRLEEKLPGLRPSSRMMVNVHLDGMESTHDRAAGRPGVFQRAVAGIVAAKRAGFLVFTNTTIYRQTDVREIAVLLAYLTEIGVDGFMVSPAYGYDAVRSDPGRGKGVRNLLCEAPSGPSGQKVPDPFSSGGSDDLFMTREEVHAKFRQAEPLWARMRLVASPIYRQFLCGRRPLPCAAWANPTRNVRGWKGPCYLITDRHYATYRELVESTDWERLGKGGDPRCEHCLVHCGFEPAAVFAANHRLRDVLAMARWQMT